MRGYLLLVVAAAATLAGSTPAGSASAGAAARAVPGEKLWAARFGAKELSSAMAVSPGGRTVFVAGSSYGGRGGDSETVAYSAASGRQLWVSRYHGPSGSTPTAVAVSPGSGRVFVTGIASGWGTGPDYVTVAYSATTGRQLWVSRYNGPANTFDGAAAVAVSPGGGTVFVTGTSTGRGTGQSDYATVAYSAATGRQLWVNRYNGPANGLDGAHALAVSPGGATVFVTGTSDGRTPGDYATVAYSAATGRQLWVSRYTGPGKSDDGASAVAVSPGGGRVFVTGTSNGLTTKSDYVTVAYSSGTGRQLWVRRYNDPANGFDGASALAVSPGGATVFVTGYSGPGGNANDYATVAYSAATGRQRWVSRYHAYEAASVAVSPGGGTVYVTGSGYGAYATVAYRAATGTQLWASHYGAGTNDGACCVAVSRDGTTVFVTGIVKGRTSYYYATVAYRG